VRIFILIPPECFCLNQSTRALNCGAVREFSAARRFLAIVDFRKAHLACKAR
jgi:hypothetical protein